MNAIETFTAQLGKTNTRDLVAMLEAISIELSARDGEVDEASTDKLWDAYEKVKASFDFLDEQAAIDAGYEWREQVEIDYRNAAGWL